MAGPDVNVGRLLARFEQRSRLLECEVQHARELDLERRRLLESERQAAARALAAHQHLARLQRVTSALCEAEAVADVYRVMCTELAEVVSARRAVLALANGVPGSLTLFGGEVSTGQAEASASAEGSSEPKYADKDPISLLQAAHGSGIAAWPGPSSLAVVLPLTLGPRRLGAVLFELEQAHELTPTDRTLVEDLVRQLALALDRVTLRELAQRERARAEEASQVKDEFLAVLGHELRNPLAPILTAVSLLGTRLGDVARNERLIIERQCHHMVRLVDDLLDVSRMTRGSLRLSRQPTELAAVVQRAVEMASPMIEERSHQLSLSVPTPGFEVEVDAHRMAQAIAHLLMNAAKYTPNGGSIDVSASSRGARLVLSIHDNGVGMDAALLERVFEPFVQRPQALDRSGGGLGLGLTIARRLVELHGGTLSATSSGIGRGSTFNIELPLARAFTGHSALGCGTGSAPPSSRSGANVGSEDAPGSSTASGVRVLVVDDNVDAAEMLAEALRAGGHIIRVAHDGPSALSLADGFQPELALLDIGLPVMNGFDLAERMRARLGKTSPMFVAITGYGRPADRARAKQVGFDEHLLKPVDLTRLNQIIRQVARRSAPAA